MFISSSTIAIFTTSTRLLYCGDCNESIIKIDFETGCPESKNDSGAVLKVYRFAMIDDIETKTLNVSDKSVIVGLEDFF